MTHLVGYLHKLRGDEMLIGTVRIALNQLEHLFKQLCVQCIVLLARLAWEANRRLLELS